MEQKRDLAIVLRWVPFEERHRVVTALTERHGRISALARNSIQSRRFGGALEPFAAAEWLFVERQGADLYRVEEAHIRRGFEGLRQRFERLALASVFNELMLKLAPEREPCPDLFRLHSNALAVLEELPLDGDPTLAELKLLNAYLAKVLQWAGNQPQILACLGCQKTIDTLDAHQPLSCVVSDAGWVCSECRAIETRHVRERAGQGCQQSLLRITPSALFDFHASMTLPIRQIVAVTQAAYSEHEQLFEFLEALLIYHAPGFDKAALKSLRFLGLRSSLPPHGASPRQSPLGPA
jgi:DNA repair protein RecO